MKHEYTPNITMGSVGNPNDYYYPGPHSAPDRTQTTSISTTAFRDFVREANKNAFSPSSISDIHSITTDSNTFTHNTGNITYPRKSLKHTLPMNIINILND